MTHPHATRPIPIFDSPPTTADLAAIGIDADDPRAHEKLLDIGAAGVPGRNYYARTDCRNLPYNAPIQGAIDRLLARESVVRMLVQAHRGLAPYGLGLYVLDAYRPVETQRGIWNFFRARIAASDPAASAAAIDAETKRYVSHPGSAGDSVGPLHASGGAVDLWLIDLKTGEPLEFGAGFDEMNAVCQTDHFERLLAAGQVAADDPPLCNRRILYWSMREVGFTNYPYEYWHYDYGDRMYALCARMLGETAVTRAWYSSVDLEAA